MIAINQNPLSRLSDSQLIKRLDALVQKERETTLEVIRHIIEFDQRKLYLGVGYGSLYDYCTLHLGLSESAAMRRIKTARCIREFPEIFGLLTKNQLNLTSICMLADILTEDNKKEVLKETCCKSKRQLEEIVARYKPGKDINDRVRTIFVKATPETAPNTSKSGAPGTSNSQESRLPNWGKFTTAGGGEKSAASTTPGPCTSGNTPSRKTILKKKYKLEFTIEPECMKKVEEVKAILSRKYPEGVPLGILLEEMADEYLEKHSPERKRKRREKRQAKQQEKNREKQGKQSQTKKTQKVKATNTSTKKIDAARSKSRGPTNSKHEGYNRHIPQAIQDEVFTRDKGKCSYVGNDGVRCNSSWNLEIDHIIPYAKGGNHSIDNLRLLCAKHNNLEAERVYGKKFMKRHSNKARRLCSR
jgi:5-methylcytosine-specific restriction endonuclease McrA